MAGAGAGAIHEMLSKIRFKRAWTIDAVEHFLPSAWTIGFSKYHKNRAYHEFM